MAAPATVSPLDFSGTFVMNKKQSDETDDMLTLQGISWVVRKVIKSGSLTLYIKQAVDEHGTIRINVEQVGTGGLKASPEALIMDWEARDVHDSIFGHIKPKARKIKVADLDDEFLKDGWLADTHEHGALECSVESDAEKNKAKWTIHMVWGFAEIDGERKYIRRLRFTGPEGQVLTKRIVYDYAGPNTRA